MLIASRVMPWAEGSVLQHSAFLKARPRPHQGVYIIVFHFTLVLQTSENAGYL